jgi:hypothetical protein
MKIFLVWLLGVMPALVQASKANCHNPEPAVFSQVWPVGPDVRPPPVKKFSRCEWTANFDASANTWTAIVQYIYKDEHGKDMFPMGAWTMYVLSPEGKLLQSLPGE